MQTLKAHTKGLIGNVVVATHRSWPATQFQPTGCGSDRASGTQLPDGFIALSPTQLDASNLGLIVKVIWNENV